MSDTWEVVDEDIIEMVFSKMVAEAPELEGLMPPHSLAREIAVRAIEQVGAILEDPEKYPLGWCKCLAPITEDQLRQGRCNVCNRNHAIHTWRPR